MAATMGDESTKTFFGCPHCHEVYPEQNELEVHCRMIHPGQPFSVVMSAMPEREMGLLKKAPTAAISKRIPLSEVNRHCTPEDCWVGINGKVYDLSEFADRHPGGPTSILTWAGKDPTKLFNDIHKGVKIEQYLRPEAFVGELGIDEDLMTDSFWHTLRKARIVEIEEELNRLRPHGDEHPAMQGAQIASGAGVVELLQAKGVSDDLRIKVQRRETEKRVAFDQGNYSKAQEIQVQIDELLSEARVELACKPDTSGGITLSEVARHNKPHDCWVAVNDVVYDLTDFLVQHPEQRNAILAQAGRDASAIWNKIPGRFPSSTWMDFYMRPESRIGDVAPEPEVDARTSLVRQLQTELRRLRGPSEADVEAAKAAASRPRAAAATAEASAESEEARFPKLVEVRGGRELPFFTRAEVAKHNGAPGGAAGTEPYMIIHNKVYDLTSLIGSHPGGDDMLLSKAGADATKEFELFEHSEKARVKRDQEMLVGELVPAERADFSSEEVAATGGEKAEVNELQQFLKYKAADAAVLFVLWYLYQTIQNRKPLSRFTYSRGLRHLHFIMAAGIFGTLASVKAAAHSEGLAKKRWLAVHKQTGVVMLGALLVRMLLRLGSGIPPRFPGNATVMKWETRSLRAFYALMLVLPLSGMANEYLLRYSRSESSDKVAQQALTVHKSTGKFFELVWLPFHLGYTTLYHWSRGRGVVRKVSPFI